MPSVPAGEQHHVVLTTAPPAGMVAKDGAAPATAATFTLTKREPVRLTGQYEVRVEDLALLPSMEADLRVGIQAQMATQYDSEVIAGDGSPPNLSSLFHQATDVSAATAVETFQSGVARFASLVEGTHSNSWGDLRALIGTQTFALYAGLFQSNGDISLFDYLASPHGRAQSVHQGAGRREHGPEGYRRAFGPGAGDLVRTVGPGRKLSPTPTRKRGLESASSRPCSWSGRRSFRTAPSRVVEVHPQAVLIVTERRALGGGGPGAGRDPGGWRGHALRLDRHHLGRDARAVRRRRVRARAPRSGPDAPARPGITRRSGRIDRLEYGAARRGVCHPSRP